MVQQTPLNPLTQIIHQQCLDQLPQISLNEQIQSSEEEASSSDESIPEWSTKASSQTDPEDIETPPPHFMAQTETSGQGETFVVDNDDEEMSTTPPSREAPPIKCPSHSSCSCSTKIKKHKKYKHYDRSSKSYKFKRRFNNKKGPWKFLRRKKKFGKSSNRCYMCGMKSHFAKQCPKGKTAKLISHIQEFTGISLSDNDVESIFSVDEEITPETLCALQPYSDYSDPDNQESFYKITAINSVQPVSIVKMQVIPSKYSLLIKVAAFFDTGASFTIMNPDILPKEFWRKKKQYFHTTDINIFCTELISKPIKLQFFPGCTIIHQILGSKLLGKDLIIGFDVYTKKKGLRILPSGLAYKQYFTVWEPLIQKSCGDSHSDFLKKCPHPLWKNEKFFIAFPFKLNEDINPTKASHPGMNPKHQQMAIKECEEFKLQGLIEATTSAWACHAFYVNKRSEQVRGKQRLVINYQPLNHFLADNKFPLPNRNSLFSNLLRAKVFSKFDLKAGFWQLEIKPEDRPKTAFFIPNQHYQWTVMPFGLKPAPSLFQKAMTTIYGPLLSQALVYKDDILLFSPNNEAHNKLLAQFAEITEQYGVMLSERKMHVGQSKIKFLGMKLFNG
ncbi:hypothetical protein UlMin_026229 [Ulmus minor]